MKLYTDSRFSTAQAYDYKGDDYFEWSVWIEGQDEDLDLIETVWYVLHPTFRNPRREINDRSTKFKLETSGWGTFNIPVKIILKNGEVVNLEHELELYYPSGEKNME